MSPAITAARTWHAACSVPRVRPLLLALATLAACDAPETDDEIVARDTIAALGGSSAQLKLYDGLLGIVDLKGISLALAPQQIINQIEGGLADDLDDPKCLTLATDRETHVALLFKRCRYRGVFVDGDLRIDLTTETGTCDGADCVLATRYTTTLTALTIGQTEVQAATSTLRIPTTKGEPRSYTAEAELTTRDRGDLHLRHEISWVRQQGCVHADLGAEFVFSDRTIDVGAAGIEVCAAGCPRAGEVHIAWASGRALSWTYDGTAEIDVVGPRGRTFSVEQSCDDDP